MKSIFFKGIAALGIISLTSCSSTEWSMKELKTVEGFDIPESMIHDKTSDLVYVSNIETSTAGFWENDGKSFITEMKVDGGITKKHWLNSTSSNKLNALKGLTILDGYLYFTDNAELKRCRLSDPTKVETFTLPKAQKLNDLATDGRSILVSDTGQGVIYRFFPSGKHTIIKAPKAVNGVTYADGNYYAVSFGEHEIYELDVTGKEEPKAFGLATHFSNLDGIEVLEDGTFIISDLSGHSVYSVSPDRKKVKKLAEPKKYDLRIKASPEG